MCHQTKWWNLMERRRPVDVREGFTKKVAVLLNFVLSIWSCLWQVKTVQRFRGNILVKYLTNMWYVLGDEKNEWSDRESWKFVQANQTLLFKRLQNNLFLSRPIYDAIIFQIFSFTKPTKPHTIQLAPNICGTSFHQPDKISFDSLQLVPKYI